MKSFVFDQKGLGAESGARFIRIPGVKICRLTAFFTLALCLVACGNKNSSDTTGASDSTTTEEFHADNDIAMTIRSVADAIRVGEPLDTIENNYECVFTDGQGSPLFTNHHGTPGRWAVDATTPTSLTITNIDFGDLIADDLESYIVSNMGLDESNIVETMTDNTSNLHRNNVYDFGGGQLRVEIHSTLLPDGLEAPLMVISLSKTE